MNNQGIYVKPNQLTTAIAHKLQPGETIVEGEYQEWKKLQGDYLYLHPYWYAFDAESKLSLVGKGSLKLSTEYGLHATDEEIKLDLETLLDMPLGETLHLSLGELNSMVVYTLDPNEPEKMFHPNDYVCFDKWLYQANKKMILTPIGKIPMQGRDARIDECLDTIYRHNPALKKYEDDVHVARDEAWGTRREVEKRTRYDGKISTSQEEQVRIVERMLEMFNEHLFTKREAPKVGDRIEATYSNGYKLVADCVPDPGMIEFSHKKGIPFVFAISVYDPLGNPIKSKSEGQTPLLKRMTND